MDTKNLNSSLMQEFEALEKEMPQRVSKGGKRSIYRPEVFVFHASKYGRDAKQTRNFVRREFLTLCTRLQENDLNAVNAFNRYYHKYFVINDYTLESVTDKVESAQNTFDFAQYKRALAIAKKFNKTTK